MKISSPEPYEVSSDPGWQIWSTRTSLNVIKCRFWQASSAWKRSHRVFKSQIKEALGVLALGIQQMSWTSLLVLIRHLLSSSAMHLESTICSYPFSRILLVRFPLGKCGPGSSGHEFNSAKSCRTLECPLLFFMTWARHSSNLPPPACDNCLLAWEMQDFSQASNRCFFEKPQTWVRWTVYAHHV